jgi:hypothetical protein
MSLKLSALAFFGEPGFRGEYGFYDKSNNLTTRKSKADDKRPSLAWAVIATPVMAKYSSVKIERGRLVLRYGVLARRVDTFELHWIGNITYHRTLVHRMTGNATVVISIDGGPFQGKTLYLPCVASGDSAETFCNRVRHASQMVRRSDAYARGLIH